MCNRLIGLAFVAVLAAQGQNQLNSRSTMHIVLPDDSPLAVLSADWGESTATMRGSALKLDLHTSLTLRNVSNHRVRGVTLLVLAQEIAPGGKASVSVPSLDVGPGEAFPIRLDLGLLRPRNPNGGPLVEISLDGVLFEDLSFYGPNRLNSKRSMTMWELEAQRDRKYLRQIYETAGGDALRQHLQNVQARLSERPKMDVQLARGRTTAQDPERAVRFAFLRLPGEPVRPMEGSANVSESEARSPHMEVENTGARPVKYLEIGWILRDREGEEFFAGVLPASVDLQPGQRTQIRQEASLKVSQRNGQPTPITGMTGFVNQVEFSDGSVWIPERHALDNPRLRKVLNPSPEEQRLSDMYRRKGLQSVIDELRRR
ncbi:MAG: hypothetical protein LC126_26125 [Bryobacterales bacterium]|nr:hypothetical protein [Bryobacterales bacterium]